MREQQVKVQLVVKDLGVDIKLNLDIPVVNNVVSQFMQGSMKQFYTRD